MTYWYEYLLQNGKYESYYRCWKSQPDCKIWEPHAITWCERSCGIDTGRSSRMHQDQDQDLEGHLFWYLKISAARQTQSTMRGLFVMRGNTEFDITFGEHELADILPFVDKTFDDSPFESCDDCWQWGMAESAEGCAFLLCCAGGEIQWKLSQI